MFSELRAPEITKYTAASGLNKGIVRSQNTPRSRPYLIFRPEIQSAIKFSSNVPLCRRTPLTGGRKRRQPDASFWSLNLWSTRIFGDNVVNCDIVVMRWSEIRNTPITDSWSSDSPTFSRFVSSSARWESRVYPRSSMSVCHESQLVTERREIYTLQGERGRRAFSRTKQQSTRPEDYSSYWPRCIYHHVPPMKWSAPSSSSNAIPCINSQSLHPCISLSSCCHSVGSVFLGTRWRLGADAFHGSYISVELQQSRLVESVHMLDSRLVLKCHRS